MKAPALTRRRLLRTLVAAASLGAPAVALRAQPGEEFGPRPITLWVPWPAGGATDLTLRLLAELAGRQLGQRVIVENRGGAGGTLAMPILQQAAPDGHTIAQMPQTVLRAPYLQRVLWDPIRDTTAIIQLSGVTFGMLTQPDSSLKSLDDVLMFARRQPGALTVATNGVGSTPHLAMDELMAAKGLSYVHVPYKGTAEQMIAVASGQVMVGLNSNGFAPFVDSGRLRLLLTLGEQRTIAGRRCPRCASWVSTSWPCRPMVWPVRVGCPRVSCNCCTTDSRPHCSTPCMWPSWPSTTRKSPTSAPRPTAAHCARVMPPRSATSSAWAWRAAAVESVLAPQRDANKATTAACPFSCATRDAV